MQCAPRSLLSPLAPARHARPRLGLLVATNVGRAAAALVDAVRFCAVMPSLMLLPSVYQVAMRRAQLQVLVVSIAGAQGRNQPSCL